MKFCFAISYLYLRYTIPEYEATSTVLIKDDNKGGDISELSAFSDLGILGGKSNIENEIEILKSRSLMTEVVKDLHLNIQYLNNDGPISKVNFKNPPIRIYFLAGDSSIYNVKINFEIEIINENEFLLKDLNKKSKYTKHRYDNRFVILYIK